MSKAANHVFTAGAAAAANYIEDVFSTYLYAGTGSAQVVENNIALGDTLAGGCVSFNGVSDYLVRNSDLTGNSDGTTFTLSFWAFITNDYSTILRSDNGRVEITIQPTSLTFDFKNTSGTSIWRGNTASGTCPKYTWLHVLISVDTSGSSKIYINDTDVTGGISYVENTTGTIDFTDTKFGIGAYANGSLPISGKLTHFFLDKTYRNLSVSANRRLFITASGEPATGLESLNPILYLPLNDKVTVGANSGTGGDFTKVNSPTALSNGGPYTVAGTGKGGMVWTKSRSNAISNINVDSVRGGTNALITDSTAANNADAGYHISSFNSNGYTLQGAGSGDNSASGYTYASWTFRKQPKFFDVLTYTGNGTSGRTVSHNLGSTPGFIMVKMTSTSGDWVCYHRSLGATKGIDLNYTNAAYTYTGLWNNTEPTSTQFTLGDYANVNLNGATYVAYLFAHDAGGFGLSGTDNVISCGSYVGTGGSTVSVNLGYEPQWLLIKQASGTAAKNWWLIDNMRGMTVDYNEAILAANLSDAETSANLITPTATGFIAGNATQSDLTGVTYIYIAIRRGPMKVPTDGTKVFQPVAYTGTNVDNRLVDTSIVTDMTMARIRSSSAGGFYIADRLRGNASLGSVNVVDAENTDTDSFMTPTVGFGNSFSAMNGFGVGNDALRELNQSSTTQLAYAFRRAPGFFDEVCYTGTGSATTVTHNLGVVPELMIIRRRDVPASWSVYSASIGNTGYLELDTSGATTTSANRWNNTTPTSTVFTVATASAINASAGTYVAYLFATCAGVSKVGSFTQSAGVNNAVDCGFAAGARYVLIKSTAATTNDHWYVWDSARGIISGNDPYLRYNLTNAEYVSSDSLIPNTAGFTTNGGWWSAGNYIFLAIA